VLYGSERGQSIYSRVHEHEVVMEVTLAVACEYANVTEDGKQLNIMGVFQEINSSQLPAALPQLFLVVSWEAGPAEFGQQKEVRVAFMDQDANEKLRLEGPIVVQEPTRPGARAYINQIFGLGGIPIERPGEHAFYVLVGGEEKRRVPLYVNEPQAMIGGPDG
jgi:hypothetical protein